MSSDGWLDKTKPFHKWNKSGIWFKIAGGVRVESAGDSRIGHRLTVELGAKWTIRSLCVLKTTHKRAGAATTSAIHSHILQPTHTLEVELWPEDRSPDKTRSFSGVSWFSAVWRLSDETQGWPPQLHHLNTHSRDHQCAGACLWAQHLGGS